MHTLVFWAATLSLVPLAAGIFLEAVIFLRDAMAPPGTKLPSHGISPPQDSPRP